MLLLGDDERVDLEHRGVEIAEGAVAAEDDALELARSVGFDAETEGDFAGLEGLHADSGVDGHLDDGVGLAVRDFLDVHAAGGRRDDDDLLGGTVHDEGEIDLLVDVGRFLDVEARDELAGGAGLDA